MATQDTTVTIVPYIKVHSGKMQEFKALCERFVEMSKAEAGCLYYGFSFNGDVAFCREGYKNAEIAARLGCAVPTIERRLRLTRRIWQQVLEV